MFRLFLGGSRKRGPCRVIPGDPRARCPCKRCHCPCREELGKQDNTCRRDRMQFWSQKGDLLITGRAEPRQQGANWSDDLMEPRVWLTGVCVRPKIAKHLRTSNSCLRHPRNWPPKLPAAQPVSKPRSLPRPAENQGKHHVSPSIAFE